MVAGGEGEAADEADEGNSGVSGDSKSKGKITLQYVNEYLENKWEAAQALIPPGNV